MSATRRGGIPGPESRTGLVRPTMTEAEFERRMAALEVDAGTEAPAVLAGPPARGPEPEPEPDPAPRPSSSSGSSGSSRSSRNGKGRGGKARRVQRMFAIDEDIDKKLWLYAIHVGKDRSEVVNDLLRPLVGSMVLYDSRERRNSRGQESDPEN